MDWRATGRRAVLRGLAGFSVGAAASTAWAQRPKAGMGSGGRFDAVLSRDGKGSRGAPGYKTLGEALAAAPATGTKPFRILVTAGTWRERAIVDKPNIHLIGEGQGASVIVFNDSAQTRRQPGAPNEIATLVVQAPDFHAAHLTIANDFDYPGHMPAEVPYDRTGASGSQATALKLGKGSDRALFDDVAVTGWQDTLYTDAGRSLFRRCFISGCVDFIYGMGVAVFDHCEILTRTRPGKDFHGFIAAPDTDRHQRFGLIFLDCRLVKDKGMAPRTVALGRPWRHTTTFPDGRYGNPDAVPQAAFLRCWMDDHIVPEAWYPMHYNLKDGRRTMLQPEDARLFEYASRGPGAGKASARRRQLTARQALDYRPEIILKGWTPA